MNRRGLKTPLGLLGVALPQTRQTTQPFRARLVERLGGDGVAGHRLVTGMYVRGLSTRDVAGLFPDAFGERVVSQSGVSQITARRGESVRQWRERALSHLKVVSLFLDAMYLAMRSGPTERAGVVAASGIVEDGQKVLLPLAVGARESSDAWLSFLHDLTARGLQEPLLVVIDGHPGVTKALREVFPHALRQRCQAHTMRNILAKLPRSIQSQ